MAVMFSTQHSTGPHAQPSRLEREIINLSTPTRGRRNSAPLPRSSLKTSWLPVFLFRGGVLVQKPLSCFVSPERASRLGRTVHHAGLLVRHDTPMAFRRP